MATTCGETCHVESKDADYAGSFFLTWHPECELRRVRLSLIASLHCCFPSPIVAQRLVLIMPQPTRGCFGEECGGLSDKAYSP